MWEVKNKMADNLEKTVEGIKKQDEGKGRVVELITQYGGIDGAHHKQWLLDQTLRTLLGDSYNSWREAYDNHTDENGEIYGEWDEGIAP